MIIRSMRLKNIKSYGEGLDGHGVTVSFEPGTNRIAGKNGHGKTTLIESLGYALFLTEPIFEEKFLIETYFLRAGKKSAEIDVTFSRRGEVFRIERGLGPNNKRQTKAIQADDESTCAEGERETSAFLCRLLGLPDPRRLRELFWKLIGVRQGRMTVPFDSKPAAAKEFFEPLLDVAVFRDCYQSLKPAVDEFIERRHQQEKIKASIDERIRERSDSPAGLEAKRRQFKEIELHLETLNRSRHETLNILAQLEMTESSLKTAESQLNAAQNAFDLARQQREIAEQRMQESIAAANIVELSAFGHLAYANAGKELLELRARQAEQHRLEMEMVCAEKKKIEIDGKREVACSQISIFARQQQEREAERTTIRDRIEAIRTHLRISEPDFERQKNLANLASGWLSDIRHFLSSFADSLARGEAALSRMKEIAALRSATDLFAAEKARNRERAAAEALQIVRQQLAAAHAENSALRRQLEEIGEGVCPLLKEQCRQFDPSKVAGDLKEKSATIQMLEEKRRIAESELYVAQAEHEQRRKEENSLAVLSSQLEQRIADFSSALKRLTWQTSGEAVDRLRQWIQQLEAMPACPEFIFGGVAPDAFEKYHRQVVAYLEDLKKWWQGICVIVQDRIDTVQREEGRRNADRRDELNFTENLGRIEAEIEKLIIARNEQLETVLLCTKEIAGREKTIANLDEKRRALGFFGDQIVLLEQTQQKFRNDYERFLGAKSLADEQRPREIDLNVRREQEQHASEQLRSCEAKVLELGRAFDAATLKATRGKYEEINAAVAMESVNHNNARRELEREEGRFSQWQEACATREKILREVQRLEAGIKLTELARTVLRDSAPAVAQHLCHRIAGRAQQIFNQINHDPVELTWEAAPRYSLRIIPGDRRFAMLSGGEQTKLALAMTLAMIQELSGLRFCIFDEPTYGVDAESREKLGEVMLDAQKAADLEQLILVSHDGAFDGKIEHSIFLRKTATHGTEVVELSSSVR